jgi:universal stress protein E
MADFKNILCVLDPTDKVGTALNRSVWLAKATGAKLNLLTCYYNEYLSGERFFDSASLKKARTGMLDGYQQLLDKIAAEQRDAGLKVQAHAVWDHPLDEGIVRHALKIKADLVIKDKHSSSQSKLTGVQSVFTNTDWNLIRTCPMPLWFSSPSKNFRNPKIIASIDPMHEHDKPAALDDQLLIISQVVADKSGGEVHAFHAYDPRIAVSAVSANAYIPMSLPIEEIEREIQTQHQERFDEVCSYHRIEADHAHLVSGLTHEKLPELVEAIGGDLVVMGAVSRNKLKRLFIGATAERTLSRINCDVLIIKPSPFRTPVELVA